MLRLLPLASIASRYGRRTLASAALLGAVAAPASAQIAFDTFNDGDVTDVDVFSGGATGIGAGVGPTTGVGGADNTGLNLGVNPGAGGGFAGVVVKGPAGNTDVSGQTYFSFYVRPTIQASNMPLLLEINFQEDTNGDGTFDGAVDDEFQVEYRLSNTTGYQFVQIPIASFVDDNSVTAGANNGFDFTKLLQVVYAIGNIPGPEFSISFDELGFTQGDMTVAAGETPRAFAAAPVAFPNPTSGTANVTFELASAQPVVVDVVDVLGRRVALLADGPQAAGAVRLAVPTSSLSPGVYVVRVQTATGVASTRLTVAR